MSNPQPATDAAAMAQTARDDSVCIPPVWCPIAPRISPYAAQIEDGIHQWLSRFGLEQQTRQRALATLSGEWAARVAPDGAVERLQIFADWVCLAFVLDDYYVDSGPIMDRPDLYNPMAARMLVRLLQPDVPVLDDNPFSEPFGDIVARFQQVASPLVFHMWLQGHALWLMGSACSVSDRRAGRIRSLDDHLLIGPLDKAETVTTAMIEVAEGTELPAHERNRREVRALQQSTNILITGYNDIASYRHEIHQQSPESNLVHIIQTHHDLTGQQAMTATVALLNHVMRFFLTLRRQLTPTAGPELLRFMDQLGHKIRGNIDWQRTVPRYTTVLDVPDSGSAHPHLLTARAGKPLYDFTDAPEGDEFSLPASIGWWSDLITGI
ncbi:terpene synthase family protein [Streptomyces sp. NPDC001107]